MKTSIVVVTYNFKKWLNDFFENITPVLEERSDIELLIIDNKSTDGTDSILSSLLLENTDNSVERDKWFDTKLKNTKIFFSSKNKYFAGGNNIGMQYAIDNNSEYVFLLNQDAFLKDKNSIKEIEDFMDNNKECASCQPIIIVKSTGKVNSAGVSLNYLHIGFCRDFNKEYIESNYKNGEYINYAMGAGVMFRVSALRKTGLFPEEYQMYHEDSFLQLRMKYLGYKIELLNKCLVEHDYAFGPSSGKYKYYFTERNRIWNFICFYRLPTVILILPMFIIMELGMIFYSIITGWFKLKMKSYKDSIKGLKNILIYRKQIQSTRIISDRDLLLEMVDKIQFDSIQNPLLDIVANNLLWIYYKFILMIIWW